MIVRRFARTYAKAIMDVAGSVENAAAVRRDLDKFETVRSSSTDLREVFQNPGIAVDAKVGIVNQIAQRLGLTDLARKALEVLVRNHRINDLDTIAAALAAFVNHATNTVVAEVRCAHRLSDSEITGLRRTLESRFGKNVEVQLADDPDLLGGFVARIGSEIYDASVTGKIHKFRESLS